MPAKSNQITIQQKQAGRLVLIGVLSFFICPIIAIGLMALRYNVFYYSDYVRLFLALIGMVVSLYGIIGGIWLTILGVTRYERLRKKLK